MVVPYTNHNRIAWIDNIRLFAILCVVFGHSCFHCSPEKIGYAIWGFQWVTAFIVSFNMQLFVFLSGYCACKSIERIDTFTKLTEYWLKISKRVAIPAFVFNFFGGIIQNTVDGDIRGVIACIGVVLLSCLVYQIGKIIRFKWIYEAFAYLVLAYTLFRSGFWFFTMLLQIMVMMSFVWYVKNRIGRSWILIPLLLASFIISLLIRASWTHTEGFVLFFVGGMLFLKYDLIRKMGQRPWLMIILVAFGLLSFPLVRNMDFYSVSLMDLCTRGTPYIFIIRQLCAFFWTLFFCLLFYTIINKYGAISEWGGYTLSIYMIHAVINGYLREYINFIPGSDWLLWSQCILVFFFLVVSSCLFIALFKKNEYSRVLLLGDKV